MYSTVALYQLIPMNHWWNYCIINDIDFGRTLSLPLWWWYVPFPKYANMYSWRTIFRFIFVCLHLSFWRDCPAKTRVDQK